MTHRTLRLGALALVAGAALTACSESADVVRPKATAGGDLFRSYVAIGNSITAGYQSGGINDSTQRESYAVQLATQAGLVIGRTFTYPSFADPGCPAPATQTFGAVNSSVCGLRNISTRTDVLNNVAVPTAFAWDITRPGGTAGVTPTGSVNPLQTFILGGRSQLRRALEAQPTFATAWIGNNDVLAAASVGVLTPVPGASPGLIPADTVIKYIKATVDTLSRAPTIKGGVLIGVVGVAAAPRFWPGSALLDATGTPSAFKLSLDTATGKSITVLPNCIGTTSLISSILIEQIRSGAYPPIISCAPATVPGVPASAQLGDLFVLSAAEQAAIAANVAKINAYVAAKADTAKFAYFDPNSALAALKASGAIPALPNFNDPKNPYGTYISFDGVHPRKPAHTAVANALIDLINAKYGTTIPKIG